jgi:GT2 family glycosyltransferase
LKPLSFVIITYNRPADMLELARNIAELDGAAELLEEVIVVNNASTSDYADVRTYISQHPEIPFRYLDAPKNLGVARGRNFAIRQGRAPILIMLDDDAELKAPDSLYQLLEAFSTAATERPVAIVSFKVLYHSTGEMQRNAFPHKQFDRHFNKSFLETSYYAGGAHAVTRSSIEAVGLYPEDFFYGMEEYDLSYRLIEAGYAITYSDKVVMLHKESPLGRSPHRDKVRMMWVNKCKVAWRYLPVLYFLSTAIMWSVEYLRQTGGDLNGWLSGWRAVTPIPGKQARTPVGSSAMAYLRKTKARLWY